MCNVPVATQRLGICMNRKSEYKNSPKLIAIYANGFELLFKYFGQILPPTKKCYPLSLVHYYVWCYYQYGITINIVLCMVLLYVVLLLIWYCIWCHYIWYYYQYVIIINMVLCMVSCMLLCMVLCGIVINRVLHITYWIVLLIWYFVC